MSQERPKVGVAVLILRDGKVLLGRRRKDDGTDGMYGTPGGHVEYLESFADAARREVEEETGIEIENIRFQCLVNVREFAPLHYAMVVLLADWKSGEPQNREPDQCHGWEWFSIDQLPALMTPPTEKGLEGLKNGIQLFD